MPGRPVRRPPVQLDAGVYDADRGAIVGDGGLVGLTPAEARLLEFFVDRHGELLSQERLLSEVWGYASGVRSRTVYATVDRLRKKVENDPRSPRHIVAVPGLGYRFDLPERSAPRPSTVPLRADAFIGREAELGALALAVANGRVVTLLGPGGVGKTRLAQQFAVGTSLPGGAVFCDLSDARDVRGIASAVGRALEVPLTIGDPLVQLGDAMRGRGRALFVLDNVEQALVDAAAALARWVEHAPDASFLVTSREPLRFPGEETVRVDTLPVPSEDEDPASSDAVRLLIARAVERDAAFRVSPADLPVVARIVRLLDGLPLAIELAAARAGVLSLRSLHERLNDRFGLLASNGRPPGRHGTLWATLDWSWELLAPWERVALAQLSVFEGSFTFEAAEAVVEAPRGGAPAVLDVVEALVEKSLLRVMRDAVGPRLSLLESVRAYAAARLEPSGADARAAEERHGAWYASLGDEARLRTLHGPTGPALQASLAADLENLVRACRRAIERGDGRTAIPTLRAAEEVLRLRGPGGRLLELAEDVCALEGLDPEHVCVATMVAGRALWLTGRLGEARERCDEAARLAESLDLPGLLVRAVGYRALLDKERGRGDEAEAGFRLALELCRTTKDELFAGIVLSNHAALCRERGRFREARALNEEALALHRAAGDPRTEAGTLSNLAALDYEEGRVDDALTRYEHALALHRVVGDRRFQGIVLANRATILRAIGRYAEALPAHLEALALHRQVADRRFEGITLGNLGTLYRLSGARVQALDHLRAALATHRAVGFRWGQVYWLHGLGLIALEVGDLEDGTACMVEAITIAEGARFVLPEGIARTGAALVAAARGNRTEALAHLARGEDILRGVSSRSELAALLVARARVTHEDPRAVRWLEEAEGIARSLGAGPDAEISRDLAAARCSLSAPRA